MGGPRFTVSWYGAGVTWAPHSFQQATVDRPWDLGSRQVISDLTAGGLCQSCTAQWARSPHPPVSRVLCILDLTF